MVFTFEQQKTKLKNLVWFLFHFFRQCCTPNGSIRLNNFEIFTKQIKNGVEDKNVLTKVNNSKYNDTYVMIATQCISK